MLAAKIRNEHEQRTTKISPREFLFLSKATDRLAKGMWGGWKKPAAVRDAAAAKLEMLGQDRDDSLKGLRPGYVARRAMAAKSLWNAALEGEIAVYVVPRECESGPPQWLKSPVQLPVDVLKKLIIPPKTLPDHAIRPTLKAIGGPELHALLLHGALAVERVEFERWYTTERCKGRWPSQTAQKKAKRRGRPTKQTERLKAAILDLVEEKRWNPKRPFTELAALLDASRQVAVPSIDTLCRLVRRLVVEHGDVRLHRRIRVKRRAPRGSVPI